MIIFDTNALLRCFLQDDKEIADSVQQQMNREHFTVPVEVIAEIVYVLQKVYKIDRKTTEAAVLTLTRHEHASTSELPVVQEALHVYGETNFDFVDCLMIGYAKLKGHRVVTYDKKLRKILDGFWIEGDS